jgi:hypothetical protein
VVAYKIGFFATTQHEIGLRMWMHRETPDLSLSQVKFVAPSKVGEVTRPPALIGMSVRCLDPQTEARQRSTWQQGSGRIPPLAERRCFC